MSTRKKLERRSFLQDRFDILIKKQKSGKATFNELTELDDIVNRDQTIKERILMESLSPEDVQEFPDIDEPNKQLNQPEKQHANLLKRLQALIIKVFTSFTIIPVPSLVK